MQRIISSQFLLAVILALASNSLLSVAAGYTSERGGKEVKEILLSAATCPATCYDKDGKHCCTK